MQAKIKTAVHFIGIGGVGMSALAQYYQAQGFLVSGSDMAESRITDLLEKNGIEVMIGHKKSNLPSDVSLIVISQAIPSKNPELVAAKQAGLRILAYPQAIGELTDQYKTIAIAGAHGKSTTTALAALTLIRGGLDPTVIVGVLLKELGGKNFRPSSVQQNAPKNSWLVLEADEFGRAFLEYSPFIAVVTNIDREHLDVYKNLANIKRAFLKFFINVQPGGALIINRDDTNLWSLRAKISAVAKKKVLRIIWYSVTGKKIPPIKKIIKIPGEHNLSNAMAVYELGKLLKIPEKKTLQAIGSYKGAWRRMEYRGKLLKIPVYDDYAHHPTEITATLKAFKEKFAGHSLICIFQPHQAKRLQALFKEFISAFTDADILAIIPSYTVAGRDDANPKFTAEGLAAAIAKKYPKKQIYYFADPKNIKKSLTKLLAVSPDMQKRSPVIVMMGAGDIVKYTDLLVC